MRSPSASRSCSSAETTPTLPATAAPATPARAAPAPRIDVLDAAALTQLLGITGDTPVPAWQDLLAQWQLPVDSITVDPAGPCTAASSDVHCVQGRARLDILLALDRPALLRLHAGGAKAWALLLGADARTARLRIGQRTFDLDRMLLQSHWNGEFAALWVGDTPAVPAEAGIVAFQNARGLPADGVAGPLTLMALADDAPGPRLLRVLE